VTLVFDQPLLALESAGICDRVETWGTARGRTRPHVLSDDPASAV
jgi:hypothetical protein